MLQPSHGVEVMRVEFIGATGGRMFVDESRVNEYKEAGFIPASDVIDSTARDIERQEEPVQKKKTTRRKKEV